MLSTKLKTKNESNENLKYKRKHFFFTGSKIKHFDETKPRILGICFISEHTHNCFTLF